jgi:hypothetical protein
LSTWLRIKFGPSEPLALAPNQTEGKGLAALYAQRSTPPPAASDDVNSWSIAAHGSIGDSLGASPTANCC